eukprot:CAMPEP_0194047762 /NCGR_PEP_ID=MMETSP0009_2-20130614/25426_1 /TAXON_ID=210454 /ORGANISM="Grammatophora oceanica, Strain CCMP 410" /LENGTH=287 /DNA_ID=CAMNT_0038693465 /DNA_START=20 /DNA_END=883 /DNA_ORIENTATION=-
MTSIGGNWKELLRASAGGDLPLMRYHLDNAVDPNFQHPEFFTAPIFDAIRQGQFEAVKLLLDKGTNPEIVEDSSDLTPLEVALEEKQHDIVDLLCLKLPKQTFVKRVFVKTDRPALIEYIADLGHEVFWVNSDDGQRKQSTEQTGNHKIHGPSDDFGSFWLSDEMVSLTKTKKPNVWIHDDPALPDKLIHCMAEMPPSSRVVWLLQTAKPSIDPSRSNLLSDRNVCINALVPNQSLWTRLFWPSGRQSGWAAALKWLALTEETEGFGNGTYSWDGKKLGELLPHSTL